MFIFCRLTSRSTGRGRGRHAACGGGELQASRAPAAAPVSSTVRFGETVTLEGKGIGSVETL